MKIYMAPMEGLTPVTYRKVFRRHFQNVDRYFTPFITAVQTHSFQGRDRREFLPFQEDTVPQLMAKSAEVFLPALRQIREAGYEEIDLNLGCPAPTAVTKGRGSGMLADPENLDRFFEQVFSERDLPGISIKTRLGLSDPNEIKALSDVYARYPFSEIIVHARVREQYYSGEVNKEAFAWLLEKVSVPVCYNGDLWTTEDVRKLQREFPQVDRIMLGRGLLADPSLPRQIAGGSPMTAAELQDFLEDLKNSYLEILSGERDVLFKLLDLWQYLGRNFPDSDRQKKEIRKSKTIRDYDRAVAALWEQAGAAVGIK